MKTYLKVILIAAPAVIFIIAVMALIAYYFTAAAIKRNPPKTFGLFQDKVMGRKKNKPSGKSRKAENAAALLEINMERVSVMSYDGLKLIGHVWECNNPKRIVITFHGWRSKWNEDFSGVGEPLHDMNSIVIFCEQRGQGESGGEYMCYGCRERYDVLTWADYAHEKFPELPVYVYGMSMGGTTVLMSSDAGLADRSFVHGVISDCALESARDICRFILRKNLHMSDKIFVPFITFFCRRMAGFGLRDSSTLESMRHSQTPTMFIHGEGDTFVPATMTQTNYEMCTAEKEIHLFPNARHTRSYYEDSERYTKLLASFFERYDDWWLKDGKDGESEETLD